MLALKAPESKTIHNLSVFHERFRAMELNLKNKEELTPSLRRHVYETQVKLFPCMNTYFDERMKVIDRDAPCHSHQWLFDNVGNYISNWRMECQRKPQQTGGDAGTGPLGLAAFKGGGKNKGKGKGDKGNG